MPDTEAVVEALRAAEEALVAARTSSKRLATLPPDASVDVIEAAMWEAMTAWDMVRRIDYWLAGRSAPRWRGPYLARMQEAEAVIRELSQQMWDLVNERYPQLKLGESE
jgi:hypothetical protein